MNHDHFLKILKNQLLFFKNTFYTITFGRKKSPIYKVLVDFLNYLRLIYFTYFNIFKYFNLKNNIF
ncbi:hypothetical protein HPP92_003229 [Vanilla planifolia]|uniref:Uncharacterized protein n=1 Tax=Vanilla planifolia TaxID=51239 RepID=A0A835SF79_VANPL|nr:hypothetical protein HPP92_003229 [Vanilla planifolia]